MGLRELLSILNYFFPHIAVSVVGLLVDNFLEVNYTRAVLVACNIFSAVKS